MLLYIILQLLNEGVSIMNITNIGVGKFSLKKLEFKLTDGKPNKKNNIEGTFNIEFIEDGDETIFNESLELKIFNPTYLLELMIEVPLKITGDTKFDASKDLNDEEIALLSHPLLSKSSEIIGYVTGNAFPLPEIMNIDFKDIKKQYDGKFN